MSRSEINSSQAAVAVTRFGLGARPGEIDDAARDPKGWLLAQIRPAGADQPQASLPSSRNRLAAIVDYREQVRMSRQEAASTPAPASSPATMLPAPSMKSASATPAATPLKGLRRELVAPIIEQTRDEILARTQLASTTPAGFRERWTLFWANHFTVAAKNVPTGALVGPFEREAIRPHVFVRFEDLLVASSTHPGMLLYLDQAQSAGPNSVAGQRRRVGLNENLAREILELHTVGADAGYTQADVTKFARALTGYSIGGERDGQDRQGAFLYRVNLHEPGTRTVLGRRYDGDGPDLAGRIFADLAVSPKTADHVAHKLAVHFVADDPAPALVARLSASYRKSGGDLAEVARTLVTAPEAWEPTQRKLKTPSELLVSAFRAAGATPVDPAKELIQPLTALGQRPFSAPQPNGWSEQAQDWAAPDAMVKRMTWASSFASAHAPRDMAPADMAEAMLGAQLRPATLTAVSRAESRPEAFALLIMSPEFQRR